VNEDKSVQSLAAQALIDNESLFPNNVIRAPSQNGQPGPIIEVDSRALNFGEIRVAGFDFQINYEYQTGVGRLCLPQYDRDYHYTTALQPGLPATDRLSGANDRWQLCAALEGTAALGWELGPYAATWLDVMSAVSGLR